MTLTMAAFIVGFLLLSGCASDKPSLAPVTQHEAATMAVSNCALAIKEIATATAGDAASKVAAVGAIERLCGHGNMMVAQQAPQTLGGTLWQAALQIFDIGARVYGIKAQRDIGITQSNNARDVSVSTNSAFLGMGQSIVQAGTAGYRYVQTPAPNITTTTTLSGTGVIGGGTYTGPVNTVTNPTPRVCTATATGLICVGGN